MHNILYISYDGMTDPLGQSQVLPYLCGLSAKGYKITLLSCEKPERYNQHKDAIAETCIKAGINWYPVSYTATPPVISTIKDIRTLLKHAYMLHKEFNFDIVHCRSYIAALIGQSMKRRFKTKFLFDMRGFWADERVDGGLWNLSNPLYNLIYKYFKKKEKQYFEQADYIISLTNAGRDEIHQWSLQNQPLHITVIPCCVDTQLFDPATIAHEQKSHLRNKLNLTIAQPVIGYVGSIGTWYLLDEMLACFSSFRNKLPDAVMLFVTTEPEDMIKNIAEKHGIPASAIIVQSATRKEVPLYISIMNYSLFFIKPCFSKKASSPTKQGEIMAMGIPVLCNVGVGDTAYVVDKYQSGIAVNELNNKAYNDAVNTITQKVFSPVDIRNGAIDFYSLEKGIALYDDVYKKLLQ